MLMFFTYGKKKKKKKGVPSVVKLGILDFLLGVLLTVLLTDN
jgi:hypothetical protein